MADYLDFIKTKGYSPTYLGFDVQPDEVVNPHLFKYQDYCVKRSLRQGRFAVWASVGNGKALKNGTGVLTSTGYKAIECLTLDDKVIGHDGKPCNVVGVYPQGVRECYSVTFSDGVSVIADKDHVWQVQTSADRCAGKLGKTFTTKELIEINWTNYRGNSLFIPMVSPVSLPSKDLPLDPYTLGALLGDGHLAINKVDITTDEWIVRKLVLPPDVSPVFKERLTEHVCTYNVLGKRVGSRAHNNLVDIMRSLGLAGKLSLDKFIPENYLWGSIEQRYNLLLGLLDTDGYATKSGLGEYSTSSKQLSLDVKHLAQSLGGTANILVKEKPTYFHNGEIREGNTSYRVFIKLPVEFPLFSLPRKLAMVPSNIQRKQPYRSFKNIEYAGDFEATCIAVDGPNHLFVTENHIVTHNTIIQSAWSDYIQKKTNEPTLIVAPLNVSYQTIEECKNKFNIEVNLIESKADIKNGINITNYEKLEKFDLSKFVAIALDESSILKSFSGKWRTHLIEECANTPYKLACTATPSPNDYTEIGNHAEWLGIRSVHEMLAEFFTTDLGVKSAKYRLIQHGEPKFWEWVASWAVMFRTPGDIGFPEDNYTLPKLNKVDHVTSETIPPQPGDLFWMPKGGVSDRNYVRQMTVTTRCQSAADVINESDEQWLIWCKRNDEGDLLAKLIPDAIQVAGATKPEDKKQALFDFQNKKLRVLISKVGICGFGMNFQQSWNTGFVGLSDSFEEMYQAIGRQHRRGQEHEVNVHLFYDVNEGPVKQNIENKWRKAEQMQDKMVKAMLLAQQQSVIQKESDEYNPTVNVELPNWLKELTNV